MNELLSHLGGLSHWQIAVLACYFLAQGMLISIFPEEVIVITLGLLWGQNRIHFFEALVAVWVGLLPANSMTVFIGSRFGSKVLKIRPFCWVFKEQTVGRAIQWIQSYGIWIIFLTRFIPMIRGPIYLAAGFSKIKVSHFFKVDAFASCIQIPLLLFLGGQMGRQSSSILAFYQKIGYFLGILIGGVLILKFLKTALGRSIEPSDQKTNLNLLLKSSIQGSSQQDDHPFNINP